MTASSATVADLEVAMVFSMPDTDLKQPVFIAEISEPIGSSRWIGLLDPQTGESLQSTAILGSHRSVLIIDDLEVRNQRYTNASSAPVSVALGSQTISCAPGGSIEYVGVQRSDVFDPTVWTHEDEPLETASEVRGV
jgi:hypothetical protein